MRVLAASTVSSTEASWLFGSWPPPIPQLASRAASAIDRMRGRALRFMVCLLLDRCHAVDSGRRSFHRWLAPDGARGRTSDGARYLLVEAPDGLSAWSPLRRGLVGPASCLG